jgi:hypothetical protein
MKRFFYLILFISIFALGSSPFSGGPISGGGGAEVSGLTDASNVTITGGSVTGLTELGAETITDGTLSISGGDLTTTGTVSAGTLTDGTLSISNGIISGAIDLTATGTITSSILTDGTLSINAGNLTTTGTVSAGTLTDGTVSIDSGIISDVIDIIASGTVQGGTLTDGTLSITDGDLTTTGTVSAGILTDGTLTISGGDLTTTGIVSGKQLFVDGSSSLNLTVAQISSTVIGNPTQSGNVIHVLPVIEDGLGFDLILGLTAAFYYRLDPNANDSIFLDGVSCTDGKYIGLTTVTAGSGLSCRTMKTGASSYDWVCYTVQGAWACEP